MSFLMPVGLHRAVPITTLAALIAFPAPADDLFDSDVRTWRVDQQEGSRIMLALGHAAADLDGDGDLDLVQSGTSSLGSQGFFILFNENERRFSAPVFHSTPAGATSDVVAEDLDGDGDIDLAFAQSANGFPGDGRYVLIFLNDGAGGFGTQQKVTIGDTVITDLKAADMDFDGDMDLITGTFFQSNSVAVLLNNGSAAFTVSSVALPAQPDRLAVGDLDGDGYPDVVVDYQSGTQEFALLFNDGAGALGSPVGYEVPGGSPFDRSDVALGDLDGDGDHDLIYNEGTATGYPGAFHVLPNLGDGTFGTPWPVATVLDFDAWAVDVQDVTGDGFLDVVMTGNQSGFDVWVLVPGDGAGGFAPAQRFAAGEWPHHFSTADLDADGYTDILMTGMQSRTIRVHYNRGGSFTCPPVLPVEAFTDRLATADIDLDGDLDFVTAYSTKIYSIFNEGGGAFSVTSEPYTLSCMEAIGLTDLNGDGYPDLMLAKDRNCPPYNFYTALNNGDGTFGTLVTWAIPNAGRNDFIAFDWDNDGDKDVVFSEGLGCPSCPGYRLFFLEGNGDGTFQPYMEINDYELYPGLTFTAGDFNEDGFMDFAGSSDGVAVHIGHGDGTFELPVAYGATHAVKWVHADDLNGDGHLDIAWSGFHYFGAAVGSLPAVGIVLGNGDGTFVDSGFQIGPVSEYDTISGISTLDADGDGNRDVVVSAGTCADLVLYLGNGDGTLQPQMRYGVDGGTWPPVVGDFDADGAEDVAAITTTALPVGNASVTILYGAVGAPAQPGDVDGDGDVDFTDLLALLSAWGPCPAPPAECPADFDGSGSVNFTDLLTLLSNWTA